MRDRVLMKIPNYNTIITFDSTFEMSFTASLTADTFRKLGHVATPFDQKNTFPLPNLSMSTAFLTGIQKEFWKNSAETLGEFWRNSRRIPEKLWKNSGKTLKNSGKILEEFPLPHTSIT